MIKVRLNTDDGKIIEQEINLHYLERWIEDGTLKVDNEICAQEITNNEWKRLGDLDIYHRIIDKPRKSLEVSESDANSTNSDTEYVEEQSILHHLLFPQDWIPEKGSYIWGYFAGIINILFGLAACKVGNKSTIIGIAGIINVFSGICILWRREKFLYYYILSVTGLNIVLVFLYQVVLSGKEYNLHSGYTILSGIIGAGFGIIWFRYFYRRKLMFGFTEKELGVKVTTEKPSD